MSKIKVAFVDDQRLFRLGFAKILNSFQEIELTIVAESGNDLFNQIEKLGIPDVVLIDLEMPEMDGTKVIKLLRNQYPGVKSIILTGHDDDELIIRLLEDGFNAYLHKDAEEEEVEYAITEVARNGTYTSKRSSEAIQSISPIVEWDNKNSNSKQDWKLTAKEIEILKMICEGYKDFEIADKLHKGVRTIQNQRLRLRKKINAQTTADIITFAIKNKLIEGTTYFDYKKGNI